MSHSIIRIAKVKSKTNSTGIQKHIQRENENYENVDIDFEKTHMNYDLVNDVNINLNDEIEQNIEQNYQGKRKIRTDAIKHVDGLITSDNEFFKDKSKDEIRAFFEDSKEFIENEYGKDNLLYATVHMDEKTPHMHFGIVPLTQDGRLSAKEVIGNKKELTEFQDRFNTYVNDKGYDLERGEPKHKTNKEHVEIEQYKRQTKRYEKNYKVIYEKYENLCKESEDVYKQYKETKFENQSLVDRIVKLKEEHEEEQAKLDDIRAKQEQQELEYQKLIDVLKTPINVKYEYEYKKPKFFSEERIKTDNVIISKTLLDQIDKQAKVGQKIGQEYYNLKNNLKVPELNNKIEQQQLMINNQNSAIKKKNQVIEKQEERYESLEKNTDKAMRIVNNMFGVVKHTIGEKMYHGVINKIDDHCNRKSFTRNLMTVDDNDKAFFKNKDIKIEKYMSRISVEQDLKEQEEKNRNKGRGFER